MILRIIKVILILLLSISFISCNLVNNNKKILKEEKVKFTSFFNEKFDYTENLSKVLAFDNEIVKVYKSLEEEAGDFKNLDSKKNLINSYGQKLKAVFNEIIRKYERDIGLPVRYNFYLSPGKL